MVNGRGWLLIGLRFALVGLAIVLIPFIAGRDGRGASDTSSPNALGTERIAPSVSPQGEGNTLEVRVVDQNMLAFRSPSFG